MESYIVDWLNLLLRWLHLIAGIAWIGASFYFVMLDNSLKAPKKAEDAKRGVSGELWAVHGGGFYNSQKFLAGPKGELLSDDLHWSKWEAYTTWLSGMGLVAIIYWYGASSYLIDKNVMALSPAAAVGISVAFTVAGWLFYDTLCKVLGKNENVLAGSVFVLVMAAAWALFHLFGARAAYIHVGIMIGTIMVANVFFHIIPGQKQMVADIRAGREPDPTPGLIGKQRSVHNTYFTLPVLFIMISNHYPMTYSHKYGWVVLGVIMLAGVLIRQFFVLRHGGRVNWALPAIGVVLLAGLAVAIAPQSAASVKGAGPVAFAKVQGVFQARCVSCHAAQPTQPGFAQPPKGVLLETADQIATNAPKVAETVGNRYMPIGNLTQMTDEERQLIATWFAQGAPTK
ncbi:MAG: urate hydroxylase PuuD [Betaproteobacteria bacterium]|nr:urate hydroxylase PuuD [Betaproteobacteria bacterium]